MTTFSVLDRNERIHCHKLLEASAGTGKTFAIENIVMRLLIEPSDDGQPLLIEDILVVTFTKAATRELKERIRKKLVDGLQLLRRAVAGDRIESCPDYLSAIIEDGEEAVELAIKRVERALFCYDTAQIFTIHGFCWRMLSSFALQAGISISAKSSEGGYHPELQLKRAVKDYLNSGVDVDKYAPFQLDTLVSHFSGDEEKLINYIVNQVRKPLPIRSGVSYSDIARDISAAMMAIKKRYSICAAKLKDDLCKLVEAHRKKEFFLKEDAEKLASLFDQDVWDLTDIEYLIDTLQALYKTLTESNLRSKTVVLPEELNYPTFLNDLNTELKPIIEAAGSAMPIIATISCDCQRFIKEFQEREEILGHDELLVSMRRAVENDEFNQLVRKEYKAAIVDEFQDTDPLQWEIFSRLFKSSEKCWDGYLYLVGDPKQSIYAFRQADIYTYLAAAEALGPAAHSTLDTNYRSTPVLVNAINLLFGKALNPFPLPRNGQMLPFNEVKSGKNDVNGSTEAPPLQFWLADKIEGSKTSNQLVEENNILPAMIREVIRLKLECGVQYNDCAVLVADHHQAKNVAEYLTNAGIPVRNQRGIDLRQSAALEDMIELLHGILDGKGGSAIKIALATRPIGMNVSDLQYLSQGENIVSVLNLCQILKRELLNEGFGHFFHHLMQSKWHDDDLSVMDRMLGYEGGSDYYRQWCDLADWIIHEEYRLHLTPAGIIARLEQFVEKDEEDEEGKVFVDLDEEGVSIITMHYSKGLEFEAVFALGVIRSHSTKVDDLVPVFEGDKYHLEAIYGEDDPKYKRKADEDQAEHMRRLYVALTRAKRYLYVPVLLDSVSLTHKKSLVSDIDLLLLKLKDGGAFGEGDLRSCISMMAASHPDLISAITLEPSEKVESVIKHPDRIELVLQEEFTIPGTKEFVQSFTSLTSNHTSTAADMTKELQVPHDYSAEVKTRHTLPSGNETGVILHKILEEVPFDIIKESETNELLNEQLKRYIKGTRFEPWLHVVSALFYDVVTTTLPGGNSAYTLTDVAQKKMFKETEFLYPFNEDILPLEGIEACPGFMKGVIDLVYEHEGKYYILDWKSNWLGPDETYYTPDKLAEAMKANKYDLQAAIYAEALRRFMKIFDQRSFNEVFGGVYYIFLRGVGPGTGILHFKPKLRVDHDTDTV